MPDTDGRQYRTHYRAAPGEAELREVDEVDSDDDLMSIRLPIASTGEVRNEGDDPLTTDELRGMAEQIAEGRVGVFPEHGGSDAVDGGRYSQFEKLGYWEDATVEREAADDGSDLLMATAVMPEPRELPAATGDYREALATLKSQVEAGVPVDASIGWREDESFPGGNDLMEASIVGIGADPRTNTAGADPVAMVARAAVDAGADPSALVDTVRDAVESERPLGPPEDPERFDDFDECVAELSDDPDTSEEEAERICGAWEQDKDEQQMTDDTDDPPESDPGDDTTEQDADGTDTDRDDEQDEARDVTPDSLEQIMDIVDAAVRDHADAVVEDVRARVAEEVDVSDEQEMDGDDEEDDDEDDEDGEMSADEPDAEQSADEDGDDVSERVAELEKELAEIRSGDADVASPATDGDADEQERDADDGATETRDPAESTSPFGGI